MSRICRDCSAPLLGQRRVCAACKLKADEQFVARRISAKISTSVKAEVLRRDGMTCRHCGCVVRRSRGGLRDKKSDVLSFDHFPVPVSRGGKGTVDNVVVSCLGCNQSRGDRF